MSLIAETYGELKKECQELKKENRDLKRESETLKRENNNLKTENELWKNRSVSIINEKNYMKDKLTGVHNAVVGNEYSILPVTTTLGSETHFYTETCGRHMSVTGERGAFTFKVYEGIFDQPEQAPVSKVVFGYNNEVHTVTKNDFRCRHYQGETTSNIRQEFTVVVNRTLMAKISAYFKSETGSILIIDVQ
jgi:FtsZ-binding cell division protein ZapB